MPNRVPDRFAGPSLFHLHVKGVDRHPHRGVVDPFTQARPLFNGVKILRLKPIHRLQQEAQSSSRRLISDLIELIDQQGIEPRGKRRKLARVANPDRIVLDQDRRHIEETYAEPSTNIHQPKQRVPATGPFPGPGMQERARESQ